jgi:2-dehydropantoate 2-reductase
MKILMVGSGTAGGLLGARLLENKADVSFLVRRERKLQLMTRGLHLRSQYGQFRKPVHAIAADEIQNTFDLVVVAVRSHEIEQAMDLAAPAIGPDTVVMPVVEGVRHLEIGALPSAPFVIGAVLEARMLMDADAVLAQRPPAAELTIGALNKSDDKIAEIMVELFSGRGIKTFLDENIRAKASERFAFVAAAIATAYLMGRPLQDALRMAYSNGVFERLLAEGFDVGVAAGYAPKQLQVKDYARAFRMVGRPVQVPARIGDPGRAGDECVFLLSEMIALARAARVRVPTFESAWRRLTRPEQIEATAIAASDLF